MSLRLRELVAAKMDRDILGQEIPESSGRSEPPEDVRVSQPDSVEAEWFSETIWTTTLSPSLVVQSLVPLTSSDKVLSQGKLRPG